MSAAYLDLLKEAQNSYLETGGPPDWLDETEFFWITQRSEVCGRLVYVWVCACVRTCVCVCCSMCVYLCACAC